MEKSGAATWPIQGAQPASLPSNPFRLGDLVKGKPERHYTSRLCSYPSILQISLIKDYALVQRVATASKSFLRMAVWTRSMISSPQDTFSRELLQLLSTDCTPSCFNEHKARAAKKSANVGISICILLPVPPDQLQTWQETREEKFLAASRFCWNTLQSFSTTYNVFQGVIDETKSEGHCELQDKPLPMARVGKRGWSGLVSLPPVSHSRTLPPPAALRQDLNCHHSFPSINHPIARMKCIFHDPAVLKCILLNGEITKHFLAKFLQYNFHTPDPKGSFRHNFLPELKQGGLKLPVI